MCCEWMNKSPSRAPKIWCRKTGLPLSLVSFSWWWAGQGGAVYLDMPIHLFRNQPKDSSNGVWSFMEQWSWSPIYLEKFSHCLFHAVRWQSRNCLWLIFCWREDWGLGKLSGLPGLIHGVAELRFEIFYGISGPSVFFLCVSSWHLTTPQPAEYG